MTLTMKICVLLALVAIAHGCTTSGGHGKGGQGKDDYGDKDGKYPDKDEMCGDKDMDIDWDDKEAVKKMMKDAPPKGMHKKMWMHIKKKMNEWDEDGLIMKKGMDIKEVYEKKQWMQKNTILFGLHPHKKLVQKNLEKKGKLTGFIPALLHKTCEKCGLKCDGVLVKDKALCFDEDKVTSEGLNNKYFHACAGVPNNFLANAAYNFSIPMLNTTKSQLYIRETTTDITTLEDLMGKKIGVIGKSYMGASCLRLKMMKAMMKSDSDDEIEIDSEFISADTKQALVDLLTNREVDAIVGPALPEDGRVISKDIISEEIQTALQALKPVGDKFKCASDLSLMHRKDVDFRVFGMCYYYGVVKTGKYEEMANYFDIPEELRVDYKDLWEMKEMYL